MDRKERPNLIEIREKLSQLKGIEKREFLICDGVPGGVPRGVICEITGSARTEWILSLLNHNPKLNTFWVEDQLTILPTAIQQRGVELSHVLLAEAGDKLFQTLRKALRSQLFDCVVLPGAIHEVKMLKALQLFARESNSAVIFLSKNAKQAWAIPFQVSVNWLPRGGDIPYTVEILKSKFSRLGNE